MKKIISAFLVFFLFSVSFSINAQNTEKPTLSVTSKKSTNTKKVAVVKKDKATLTAASKKTITTTEKKKTTNPKKAVNSVPKLGVMNKKDEK